MIKLTGLDKFFNRKKNNEIHVINDISLELPDKGLVILLGPSGSGKTTLLNVLGGLDKVQSGKIQFKDEIIEKYSSRTWDYIRNRHVGYIFQNYNLLSNLTVYDNIAFTLNMAGIYDKEEIDKRVDYILGSMGMINYRKRRASQLSGGQQQRVAIARALAKNPSVIIADEPTGNLDSKNTQDIMNIIKNISLNKLVVLVTHEENIANFYADRIIRLRDGKIVSDDSNRSNGSIDVHHDTDIYLGDLRQVSDVKDSTSLLKVYSDESLEDNLDIKLIVKNKTIYIDVKSLEYKKMQLLESDSEIQIYDRKFEETKEDDFADTDFDLESIITEPKEMVRHSVITVKDSLKLAVGRLRGASKLGKLFYVGFAGVSVLIALAVGMLSAILTMSPDEFLQGSADLVTFDKSDLDYDDIKEFEEHSSINYLQLDSQFRMTSVLPTIYQAYDNESRESYSTVYASYLDESKLIKGREVRDYNEVVFEKAVADKLLKNPAYQNLGLSTYKDLMDIEYFFTIPKANGGTYKYEMKLVGIVDDVSPVIYVKEETFLMNLFQVGIYDVFKDDITLTEGRLMSSTNEMLVNDEENPLVPYNNYSTLLFGQTYNAVGAFTMSTETAPGFITYKEYVSEHFFTYTFDKSYSDINFHSNNIDKTIDYLEAQNANNPIGTYKSQLKIYSSNRLSDSVGTIIFMSVTLGFSAVFYFLILRSSLLSRIYEVSVYRALGVTKNDIRKIFLTEIILITTITSMIGYLATSFVMYRIQLLAADYMDAIYISPLSILAGVIIIYFTNIVSGLIPVSNLLRRTPAEILSKYDF